MEDENIVTGNAVEDNSDYINAIKDLKENSVSKESFLKLKEENKKLLESLVNGEPAPVGVVVDKKTAKQLKDHLNKCTNDLDYVETALQLRDAVKESTGKDVFANYNTDNLNYELDEAGKVADVLKECVDLSEGNPEVFKAQLMTRLVDTPTMPKRRK